MLGLILTTTTDGRGVSLIF